MSITKLNCMELKDTRYSVYPYDGYNLEEILGKFYEAIKECNDLSFSLQEFNNWIISEGLTEEVLKQLSKVDWDNIVNSELYQKVLFKLNSLIQYVIKDNKTLNMLDIVNNSYIKILNGEYTSNKEDYALKLIDKKNVVIEGNGIINCLSNGVLIENCENIIIREVAFNRLTQSKFGESFFGVTVKNSNNIFIEKNKYSKFVDGIRVDNSTDVFIVKNTSSYCGEEGIVFTENSSGVIEDNIVTKHLGDGILLKSVNGVTVRNNKIYEPIDKFLTSDLYNSVITDLNPDIPRPTRGGGLGTNVEHSNLQCRNVLIEGNIIKNTGYGIGTIGVFNCNINNNVIDNVYDVAISISNDTTYNQNNLSSENINIMNNKVIGLLNNNSTNVVKIYKSSGNNIYNLIFSNNIINCVNDTVAHTGIYSNINCKVNNNIIDNFNVAIYSPSDNIEITNNTIAGVSAIATTKRGIYVKGGLISGNKFNTNSTVMAAQVLIDGATNLICCDNKIKYNGTEGAIQLINNSKWCILNNNSFELTSSGVNYGGGSVYNGTNKIDGYYRANTIPTEQGYNKDDIVLKSNGDIGDVVGWINQGNKSTSNFKEYGQRGFKSVDGQPTYAPRFIGEEVYDWRNKVFYKGVGTTESDWKLMS